MTELEKRYNLLVDVIKSKDLEITEYKLEGGRISRKAVETDLFDHQAFSEKCGDGVSATKSRITGHPSEALTPLVQGLLDKVSTASIYEYKYKPPTEAGNSQNENKRTVVKIKSPAKNKKLKMYDDDDDETEEEGGGEASTVQDEDKKVKKDGETTQKSQKGMSKPKVLLNL